MTKKNILLIDDDPLFLMLTRKLLEKETYLERIDTATSVEEAEQYFLGLKAENAYPDAVFIDINMPLVNGLELARQLHHEYLAAKPDTKVFILSSSISQRDRVTAEKLDAVYDYMEKPLSASVLRKALGLEIEQVKDRKSTPGNRERQKEEGCSNENRNI